MNSNVAILLALLLPGVAAAEIYRWVDERGQVHYSQTPPKTGTYSAVSPATPPGASPNQEQTQKFVESTDRAAAKQKEEADKARQEQAQRALQCQKARERLAYLDEKGPRRLAQTDDKGNVSRYTEEDFQKDRALVQDRINKNCS